MARLIIRLAWLWMILIGYILITPIGPICIACGVTDPAHISNPAAMVLGVITLAFGVAGLTLGRKVAGGAGM